MYSGSTLKLMSRFDAWFGAHQKIDRTARRHLNQLVSTRDFPSIKEIIRFEGLDGPDGIKRKTPAKDEPWHYFDPNDPHDSKLPNIIEAHHNALVQALKHGNRARSSFEAAWIAHAVVDGLTPAHHYPYEDELVRLRGGAGIETRTTPKEKIFMPGDTLPKKLSNNWQMWGDKGLLATHFAFEWGVAVMIMPLRLGKAIPTERNQQNILQSGPAAYFKQTAKEVDALHMYEQFYTSGWTPKLAKQVRQELVPAIVSTVTLTWYAAAKEAGL